MKKRWKYAAIIVLVTAIVVFNVVSIRKIAHREKIASSAPLMNETAMVIYGAIEPAGKAVGVSPGVNGIVKELYVQEGDTVQKGQLLCMLENAAQNGSMVRVPLTAPQNGLVYKCNLRIGEAFMIGDHDRLILGSPNLQICCDVEILWIGKIEKQKSYEVFNAETGELIGTANFHFASRYLRPKSLRTEDPKEKFSTPYQEVIMDFTPATTELPIGLSVMLRSREKQ